MSVASLRKASCIGHWLNIDPAEQHVVVTSGKVEIGQRIDRALRGIVCAELALDPKRVVSRPASTHYSPDEGYTAGSNSIEQSGVALRLACRALLEVSQARAARRLNAAVAEVRYTGNGEFAGPLEGAQVALWELWDAEVAAMQITGPALTDADRALSGNITAAVREAEAVLFNGVHQFVQDLECDLHARVVRPCDPRARLGELDIDALSASLTPLHVVVDGSFVALAGHDEWAVIRAAERLATTLPWHTSVPLPNEDVVARLQDYPRTSLAVVAGVPTPDSAEATAARADEYDLDITITRPYQMHGSIGPSAAMATWSAGAEGTPSVEIISHTQGVYPSRAAIAEALGLETQHVHVTHAPGSGCYGHNGADDAAFDAALIARAIPEQRVLLKWTRANEHCFEPYASAMAVRIRANLTDNGAVALWEHDSYSDTHVARPRPGLGVSGASRFLSAHYLAAPAPAFVAEPNLGRHAGIHRNADPTYTFADVRVAKHLLHGLPLRVSAMRTLGAFCNVLAIESAMDELAHLADADPLDFRARHLDDARMVAVLSAAAAAIDWTGRHQGHGPIDGASVGCGLGSAQYKNAQARCAVAAKVSVADDGVISLLKLVIAADAGAVVDPDGVKAQLEGGALQAASWTLHEQVRFDESGILSHDWDTYPILRFPEVPEIKVVLLDNQATPSVGVGEASSGPTGAAIANAVRDATGLRITRLPLAADRVRQTALQAT